MQNNQELKLVFTDTLDLIGWTHVVTREDCVYSGVAIPSLRQEVYQKTLNDHKISIGVFYHNNVLTYIAWGYKEAEHCSFHARVTPEGKIIEVMDGCPSLTPEIDKMGNVTGFKINNQEICPRVPIV